MWSRAFTRISIERPDLVQAFKDLEVHLAGRETGAILRHRWVAQTVKRPPEKVLELFMELTADGVLSRRTVSVCPRRECDRNALVRFRGGWRCEFCFDEYERDSIETESRFELTSKVLKTNDSAEQLSSIVPPPLGGTTINNYGTIANSSIGHVSGGQVITGNGLSAENLTQILEMAFLVRDSRHLDQEARVRVQATIDAVDTTKGSPEKQKEAVGMMKRVIEGIVIKTTVDHGVKLLTFLSGLGF